MAGLYTDAPVAVRDDLETAHTRSLASMAACGTWFSGAERARLIVEARAARAAAGLQPATPVPVDAADTIPAAAIHVARKVAAAPEDIERRLFDDAIAAGLSEEQYVETIGVAARISALDTFTRGLGIAPRALPAVTGGEPPRLRPQPAVDEGAWLPTIPNGAAGGKEGEALYGGQFAANILRALSLVPDEAADVIALNCAQYVTVENFMDFDFANDPAITRTQVELVAARISALNACFY